MKIQDYKTKKLVRFLTDVEPTHVSLVEHGANQTPFKVVKSEENEFKSLIGKLFDLVNTKKSDVMSEEPLTRPNHHQIDGQDEVSIRKIEFSKKYYTEKQAAEYMASMNFADYVIEEDDNYIIAKSNFEDKYPNNVQRISGNKSGMYIYLGELGEEMTNTFKSALESKYPELVKKYDYWVSYTSGSTDLNEIVQEATSDGIPIGACEISDAFWTLVRNAMRSGDYEAVKQGAVDMADWLVAAAQMVKNDNVMKGQFDMLIEDLANEVVEEELQAEATEDATETVETEVAEEAATEETNEEVATEEAIEDAAEVTEEVAEVEKSDDLLTSIAKLLDEKLVATKNEILGRVGDQLAEQDARLNTLEGVSKSRRSAEVTDEETRKEAPKVEEAANQEDAAYTAKSLANIIGY